MTTSLDFEHKPSQAQPLLTRHGLKLAPVSLKRSIRRRIMLPNQDRLYRLIVIISLIVLCLTAFHIIFNNVKKPEQLFVIIPPDDPDLPGPKVPRGYLVYGPGCKIVDLDPYAPDVMKLFTKQPLMRCKEKPLTKIQMNYETNQVVLVVNKTLATNDYLGWAQMELNCCYQTIQRSGVNDSSDNEYEFSECTFFAESIELQPTDEYILVKCKGSFYQTTYIDAHALIRETKAIRRRLKKHKKLDTHRPPSVLMIGIDSVSRLNFIRAMPKTAQLLYDTGWFEFRGYNKIDYNTFPNLMAVLVGYNNSLVSSNCNPTEVGQLDKCPFIWNYFRDNGYVTAYAEDEMEMSTFNLLKKGFLKPPTDHYFRPFALAAEANLPNKLKSSLKFCLGYKTYADYIYQYALDFATTYKNEASFGLFWSNTFSHNDISDPSSMDEQIKHYIEELATREILNNSIVIFWSDHGMRFGPVRFLPTGWLEDRLPFLFMWLPPWFREQHPEMVQNLKINRNRLINPYDLHMTLKHILKLSGRIDNLPGARSCPNCQSLFDEIPWNRTCSEIEIEAHWCTCSPYVSIDKASPIVVDAVNFALEYMNNLLSEMKRGAEPLCAQLRLETISLAKRSSMNEVPLPYIDILVVFETQPGGGKFEATIRLFEREKRYEITGTISRLNMYGTGGGCVDVDFMRKFCVCLIDQY